MQGIKGDGGDQGAMGLPVSLHSYTHDLHPLSYRCLNVIFQTAREFGKLIMSRNQLSAVYPVTALCTHNLHSALTTTLHILLELFIPSFCPKYLHIPFLSSRQIIDDFNK